MQTRARQGSSSWAARWLLIGILVAGVIGMHVLSQHDSAGGHRLVIDAVTADSPRSIYPAAAQQVSDSAAPSLPGGVSGLTAACILALVVVGGLVLLFLGQARRDRDAAGRFVFDVIGRGPPVPGPSRLSLCVLRV